MALFKIGSKAHKADISTSYYKVANERMVERVKRIRTALSKPMPKHKKRVLEDEVRTLVAHLGARDEALENIVKDILDN